MISNHGKAPSLLFKLYINVPAKKYRLHAGCCLNSSRLVAEDRLSVILATDERFKYEQTGTLFHQMLFDRNVKVVFIKLTAGQTEHDNWTALPYVMVLASDNYSGKRPLFQFVIICTATRTE